MSKSMSKRAAEALAAARAAADGGAGWVELHNRLFGIGGLCSTLFPTLAERTAFCGTDEYKQIAELLEVAQRKSGGSVPAAAERPTANGRILLRVPRSIHAALLAEADSEGVSLNQLCLTKLTLQLRASV